MSYPYKAYKIKTLADAIQADHPELSQDECQERAVVLRRELNRLNVSWQRSQERFRRRTILVGLPEIPLPDYQPF